MKKFLSATLLTTILLSPVNSFAAPEEIILPAPNLTDNLSVMKAISERKSSRDFVDGDLSEGQLSKILWAADGLNRPEKQRRVTPAGLSVYSIEIYAVTRQGIYLYDNTNHKLNLIAAGDYRGLTTKGQEFVDKAAVNLVFVDNFDAQDSLSKMPQNFYLYNYIRVGTMVQNVALAAQTEGLGNCVRGSINTEEFAKVAKIPDSKNIILAQSVGFIK
ncbi:MAG: SagB/ThcOx family dehydrogenase [Selenomonadaceae bacterium]|nr:SagB/ThcOx family dehydrogenase [Selenomonadaceae bacterium]